MMNSNPLILSFFGYQHNPQTGFIIRLNRNHIGLVDREVLPCVPNVDVGNECKPEQQQA